MRDGRSLKGGGVEWEIVALKEYIHTQSYNFIKNRRLGAEAEKPKT